MAKIKPLIPSLREKKRYVKFKIISEHKIDRDTAMKRLKQGILRYMGTSGASKAGFIIVKYDEKDQTGIVRINHKYVNDLKAALLLIKDMDQPVIIKSLITSGILKKAEDVTCNQCSIS